MLLMSKKEYAVALSNQLLLWKIFFIEGTLFTSSKKLLIVFLRSVAIEKI